LAPVALAAGRDGSLYVGDYNYIRKLSENREEITSILQLRSVPYPTQSYDGITLHGIYFCYVM